MGLRGRDNQDNKDLNNHERRRNQQDMRRDNQDTRRNNLDSRQRYRKEDMVLMDT